MLLDSTQFYQVSNQMTLAQPNDFIDERIIKCALYYIAFILFYLLNLLLFLLLVILNFLQINLDTLYSQPDNCIVNECRKIGSSWIISIGIVSAVKSSRDYSWPYSHKIERHYSRVDC